ncbi:DinB family protein [Ornithinimicrobium sp. Y1694]|uniref:DinB family protein n=1 Tax=Ornithinimicrobium sp. Y1694 TaxID=3418590 RepID=UPI003CF2D7B4
MSEQPESLRDQTFLRRDLSGSRFVGCDLSGVVVRGGAIGGMELDSPWLIESGEGLVVNGVDVAPYVDEVLNRRFPGRALRTDTDPEGLRHAWAALEQAWAATTERAQALPAGTVTESVDGEWSYLQTMRHLIMATDTWLGRAVLEREQPYDPLGLPHDDGGEGSAAYDHGMFVTQEPTLAEVLRVRGERQAMVRDFLADADAALLAEARKNPHAPQHEETVLSCVQTILEEEWEHHRYAVRDLDALAARG